MIARIALALALLSSVVQIDRTLQRAIQESRRPALERPMRAASDIGRPEVVLGALLAIAVFDAVAGPATVRLALLALAPTNLVVEGLKWAVNRERPDGERKRSNSSFPSSHAANAAAIAAVIGRRWRRVAPAAWLGALVISISRVYLNRHFCTDVLAGLAVGLGSAWLAVRLIRPPDRFRSPGRARAA
jgi:membrane-associated phospholipid phosphatase